MDVELLFSSNAPAGHTCSRQFKIDHSIRLNVNW